MREAEARFQNAFDHAPIGIALVDLDDSRFLEVNDSICEITGYSRDELLAMEIEKLIHPADRGTRHERVEQLLSGERDAWIASVSKGAPVIKNIKNEAGKFHLLEIPYENTTLPALHLTRPAPRLNSSADRRPSRRGIRVDRAPLGAG